jgi:uncharacterized protein YfcZ (UPF0381/DUF406 family)
MGATNFEDVVRGENDVGRAYDGAVQQALLEWGHDAYNGSISTTSGYRVLYSQPVTVEEAARLSEKHLDDLNKWEACGAIPLLSKDAVTTRTQRVSVAVEGDVDWKGLNAQIVAAARKVCKSGEFYMRHYVEGAKNEGTWQSPKFVGGPQAKYRVTSEATSGKAVTRYIVNGSTKHSRWEDGFATQAEARAWITAAAKAAPAAGSDPNPKSVEYTIEAVTKREDGRPLVIVRRQLVKATYPVDVELGKKKAGAQQDGWYFFGWAAT